MNSKGIALTIVAAIFSTTSLLAQESSHCGHRKMDQTQGTEEQMNHEGHGMAAESSSDEGNWMMERQQKMMNEIGAMDARLDELIREMDAAQGDEKSEAVAEVVRELVWQRKQLREKTTKLHSDMMYHVGSHMGMAMTDKTMATGEDCPMMRGMTESTEGDSDSSQTGHQH